MTETISLYSRHVGKSLLLDSNLLLVLLVGAFDPYLLGAFKRVSGYSIGDYDLLTRLLKSFTVLLTTPHILTEVSNLANHLPERVKSDWFRSFGLFIQSLNRSPGVREKWKPAAELVDIVQFVQFGIADAGIVALSSDALVVTEDYRLSGALRKKGISVLNFGDLRGLRQLMPNEPA